MGAQSLVRSRKGRNMGLMGDLRFSACCSGRLQLMGAGKSCDADLQFHRSLGRVEATGLEYRLALFLREELALQVLGGQLVQVL